MESKEKKIMIRKVFLNSKNKQLTIPLSRKELKSTNHKLKEGDKLFARVEVFKEKKENGK